MVKVTAPPLATCSRSAWARSAPETVTGGGGGDSRRQLVLLELGAPPPHASSAAQAAQPKADEGRIMQRPQGSYHWRPAVPARFRRPGWPPPGRER